MQYKIFKMIISDIKAAILAFVGLLLALIIGAACGLLLLAFHNQIKSVSLVNCNTRVQRTGLYSWLYLKLSGQNVQTFMFSKTERIFIVSWASLVIMRTMFAPATSSLLFTTSLLSAKVGFNGFTPFNSKELYFKFYS